MVCVHRIILKCKCVGFFCFGFISFSLGWRLCPEVPYMNNILPFFCYQRFLKITAELSNMKERKKCICTIYITIDFLLLLLWFLKKKYLVCFWSYLHIFCFLYFLFLELIILRKKGTAVKLVWHRVYTLIYRDQRTSIFPISLFELSSKEGTLQVCQRMLSAHR